MFVKATNDQIDQYPYTVGDLRRDHPNTSFPKRLSNEILVEWGVYKVSPLPAPSYADRTQRIEQNAQPHQENGEWVIGWSVVEKTAEEIQQYDDNAASSVRSQRNTLLSETDWMALSDNTMTPEWATYRQALRDITDHANFPWLNDEDWPVKPE